MARQYITNPAIPARIQSIIDYLDPMINDYKLLSPEAKEAWRVKDPAFASLDEIARIANELH